jgi:TolB-like protein
MAAVALHEPTRELLKGDARIRLQEQPFQILRTLLAHAGTVVTRETLRDQLWPNGTFVDFEHSLNAAVKRLRAALGDDAREPRFIETLPRRGYRWMSGALPRRSARVAVLPFSTHEAHDSFGSGLTEELIAQLTHSGGGRIHVVSRLTSMACTNASQRASEVAAALGADYLLEGGVRRQDARVRIAAWLVDARDEVQMWGDIYERDVTDTLPAQVDVAKSIARAIVAQVAAA